MRKLTMFLILGLLLCLACTASWGLTQAEVRATRVMYLPNGAVGSPGLAFWGDRNSGLYWIAADNVGLALGGVKIVDIDATNMDLTGDLNVSGTLTANAIVGGVAGAFGDGSAASPGATWATDLDIGFYRIGANNIGLSLGGTKRWDFGTATSALTGILTVSGATTISGATALDGGLTMDTNAFTVADTSGNVLSAGTLTIAGAAALNGGIACDTNAFTVADTSGNVLTAGTLTVAGAAALNGGIACDTDAFTVADTSGNVATAGTLTVTGATTQTGEWQAGGGYGSTGITVATTGNVSTNGALVVDSTSTLTGAVAMDGGITCDTNKFTVADTSGNVLTAGTLTVAGDVAVNTNKFTVTAASGNTLVAGTLAVSGAATITGVLTNKYDAAAYWTATTADAGATVFDQVSDGTPGFTFTDPITFCPSGGTPVVSAGLLGGAGTATGTPQVLGAGAGKAFSFYIGSTSTTASHEVHGFYLNVNYGTSGASAAPSGDAIRGRAWLVGDASGGTAITGGAFTVELAATTASNTGLTCGLRGNLVLPSGVMTNAGTYYGTMAEIYLGGAAVDIGAYTKIAPLAVAISGTSPTAASQLVEIHAIDFTFPSNMVGDQLIMDTTSTTAECVAKLKVMVNGTTYWLLLDNAND